MAADPSIVAEGAKAVTYVLGLAIVGIWQERKRSRGTQSHENSLNEKFGTITAEIADHRLATERSLGELKVTMREIATVVGLDSENGMRGTMREMREDIKVLQRDSK